MIANSDDRAAMLQRILPAVAIVEIQVSNPTGLIAQGLNFAVIVLAICSKTNLAAATQTLLIDIQQAC